MIALFIVLGVVGLLLVFAALSTRSAATSLQDELGLEGSVVYNGFSGEASPLYSGKYQLTGKPDCIVKTEDGHIPIELKSGSATSPYPNHKLQLGAYLLLVEDNYGTTPPHGYLKYEKGGLHKIPFTDELRADVLSALALVRRDRALAEGRIVRNHGNPKKCQGCSMRHACSRPLP